MRRSSLKRALPIGIAGFAMLSGCVSTVDDVHHFETKKLGESLTLIAGGAQLIVSNSDGTVCFGPPPDATTDLGMAANVSILSGGGSDSVTGGEEEIPLGGRNPNVLITRDLLFQSCLAEARFELTREERIEHFSRTLKVIQALNGQSLEGVSVESNNVEDDVNLP